MTNYTIGKFVLAIVILLSFAAAGRAQVVPTPEQLEFVRTVGNRIRSTSQAEVARLRTQQLQPAITAEQQFEQMRSDLTSHVSRLTARIECLNWLVRNYRQIREGADRNTVQQVNSWQRDVLQLNRRLAEVNNRLRAATTQLIGARERRLAVERIIASTDARNLQQFRDLTHLLNVWRLNPPRYTWEGMRDRITEVASEKKLTSSVTILAGAAPVTVKYQLVSGGEEYSAARCTRCVIRPSVGHYNFWVETPGGAEPQKREYFISQESHSIQLRQTTQNNR
jgi:hypothetical protein